MSYGVGTFHVTGLRPDTGHSAARGWWLGRETVRGKTRGLQMVYDAEMEVRQVADELHIPEGRVKSRLYRACREVATEWRTITREWEDLS